MTTDSDKNEVIKEMFSKTDADKDGKLSPDEFKTTFGNVGEFTDEQFKAFFDNVDKNKDGFIQIDEFMEWIGPVEMEQLKDLAKECGVNPDAAIKRAHEPPRKDWKPSRTGSIFKTKDRHSLLKDGDGKVTVKGSSKGHSWDGCVDLFVASGTKIVGEVGGSGDFVDPDMIDFHTEITGIGPCADSGGLGYGGKVESKIKLSSLSRKTELKRHGPIRWARKEQILRLKVSIKRLSNFKRQVIGQ